jgi:mannose-1-phosphate guanylyltransferase
VIVHPSAQVDESASLGPNVVIGKNCKIGKGVRISNTCILGGTQVEDYACIDGSIIGWDNVIGKWTRIIGLTVTSEDVKFKEQSIFNGAKILSHKVVQGIHLQEGEIIM